MTSINWESVEPSQLSMDVDKEFRAGMPMTRRDAMRRAGMVLGAVGLGSAAAALSSASPAGATTRSAGRVFPDATTAPLAGGIATGKLVFITFFSTLNYFDGHKKGFRDAVAAFGGGQFATVGPTTGDGPTEILDIQTLTAQKHPMAICPFEDKPFAPVIDQALKLGVPTITVDGEAPSSAATHVGTGNVAAGVTCAQRMIQELGGQGNILLTTQVGSNASFTDRQMGFEQTVAATNGKVKVVAVIDDYDDAEKAATAVGQALQAHSDINGIFTISAGAGLGTVKAVQDSGRSGVKVGVFANDPAVNEALKTTSALTFVAAQETYKMGFFSAVMLQIAATHVMHLDYNGAILGIKFPLPPTTDTGLVIIDRSNVGAFPTA